MIEAARNERAVLLEGQGDEFWPSLLCIWVVTNTERIPETAGTALQLTFTSQPQTQKRRFSGIEPEKRR